MAPSACLNNAEVFLLLPPRRFTSREKYNIIMVYTCKEDCR